MPEPSEPKCWCGQPLHYANPQAQELVTGLVRVAGELPFLGFEEVTDTK